MKKTMLVLCLLVIPILVIATTQQNQQLWTSASTGDLKTLDQLISQSVDVNYANPSAGGSTPLEAAAIAGHLDVCKALVAAGANVNQADTLRSKTPLMGASFQSQDAIVDFLLTVKGIQLDHQGVNQFTAAHDAAWVGDLHIVQALTKAGANLKLVNDQGDTVLACAARALKNCYTSPGAGPCPVTAGNSKVGQAGYKALVDFLETQK
jgi:hypothetical protein